MKRIWRTLFRRSRVDAEISEEIQSHLAMRAQLERESGLTASQADASARRKFGNATLILEDTREFHFVPLLESILQDFTHALRQLRRYPAFSFTVLLILALGIGASTAVFTVVDGVLFRAAPYQDPGRIVAYGITAPIEAREFLFGFDYLYWRGKIPAFETVTSMYPGDQPCDLTETNPARLICARVESTYLPLFGVQPILGRNFTRNEDRFHASRVALLSYGLWRTRFGGQSSVLGHTISLDDSAVTVIGVLPKDFEMPTLRPFDILLPQQLNGAAQIFPNNGTILRTFARLRPGWTPSQAAAALDPMLQRDLQGAPLPYRNEIHIGVRTLRDWQSGDRRQPSWVLLLAVLTVLLLACMNISSLLLARAASRQRELAMRQALGASRSRLARHAITESLLLGICGGVLGCALSFLILKILLVAAPNNIPGLTVVRLSPRIFVFAALLSLLSGLIFGALPAFRCPKLEIFTGWRATSLRKTSLREALVALQIAGSLIMLTAAGLMLRTLWKLETVPLGLDTEHVVTAQFTLGSSYNAARLRAFSETLEQRLHNQPGVTSVAFADSIPPGGATRSMPFFALRVPGHPAFDRGVGGMVPWRAVSPDYFETLRVHLLQGRIFDAPDSGTHLAPLMILSQSLARKLLPGENSIGQRVTLGNSGTYTIIGVVADVRNNGLAGATYPEFYIDRDQFSDFWVRGMTSHHIAVAVRANLRPQFLETWLRDEIRSLEPSVPVDVMTMQDRVRDFAVPQRFHAILFSLFAAITLLLAVSGLYGLVRFLIARRTQEIGVRIALGASPAGIAVMIVRSALRFTLAGTALGIAGALLISRWIQSMLYQTPSRDPLTITLVAALLIACGIVAALGPSIAASRTDPMSALRTD
ncbi:MAG TPA: ABC transporter permease [Bryobacteraceae bacterium]|nr:ABC transporter permease [Bryobacteraceae bacterium]